MKIQYIIQRLSKDGVNPKWHDYLLVKPFNTLTAAKKQLSRLPDTHYYDYKVVQRHNTT